MMNRILKVLMALAAIAGFGYISNMDYEDTLMAKPSTDRLHTVYLR